METQQTKNNQIKYLILYTMDGNLHIFKEEQNSIQAKKTFYKKLYYFFATPPDSKVSQFQWDFLAQSEDNIMQTYNSMSLIDHTFVVLKTKKALGVHAAIELIGSSKLKRKKYSKLIEFLCQEI